MILLKKLPDGSIEEMEADESQADFLIKREPFRYEIKSQTHKKPLKEVEIPELIDEE